MKIGCHVSIAGGVENAPQRAADFGCEVFQIFTRSPQGGKAPEITAEVAAKFKSAMDEHKMGECIVHTPYFINFGSANKRIFYGSISIIRQELDRASILGAAYVVTHLGSYKDLGPKKGFAQLISGLERALIGYKGSARLLLENAAGAGEIIGDSFLELKNIIFSPKLKKYKLGICFDTAHAFASGYDIRSAAALSKVLGEFDKTVGLENLKVIHANDSKIDFAGRCDRHDHIGMGKIGLSGFRALVGNPRLQKINLYLETEHDRVKEDIKILKKMRKVG
ncbi:MAG: deoxyribonuclease IV [Patescibacteria group bacterium]